MNFEAARDVVGTEIGRIRGIIATLEKTGLADEFALAELRKAERNLTEALPALRRRIDEDTANRGNRLTVSGGTM